MGDFVPYLRKLGEQVFLLGKKGGSASQFLLELVCVVFVDMLPWRVIEFFLSEKRFDTPRIQFPTGLILDDLAIALRLLACDVGRASQRRVRVCVDRQGSQLLFRVIADCYERKSLILTTNLEFSSWGNIFTDEQMAAAMIHRLVHHGYLMIFGRPSYRIANALMRQNPTADWKVTRGRNS